MRSVAIRIGRRGVMPIAASLLLSTGCTLFGAGAAVGAGAGTVVGVANLPDSDAKTAEGIPVGAAIRVTLTPSRDIAAVNVNRPDTTWLRGALKLTGRIDAIHGDTIHLAVTEAHMRSGRTEQFARARAVAAIHRGPDASIQVLSLRPNVAENAMIGAALGLAAAIVGLIIICSTNGCFS